MSLGNKYVDVRFEMEDDRFCCGVYNLGNFYLVTSGFYGGKRKSLPELLKLFDETLIADVESSSRHDGHIRNAGYLVTASLNQFQQDVLEFLKLAGFEVVSEFTNSNTGNIVYILHRYIPYEYIEAYRISRYNNYDDDGDDWDDEY